MSDDGPTLMMLLVFCVGAYVVSTIIYGGISAFIDIRRDWKKAQLKESRERQAIIDAHWDEEQMRLHGIPKLGRYPKWDGFKKHPIPPDKPFFIPHKNIAE